MTFGIPKEIQSHEYRVGATPELVQFLKSLDHTIFVESGAGLRSGFDDDDYVEAGATIVPSPEKVYAQADFLLKIQPPMPVEFDLVRPEHTIFAYFHFLGNLDLARSLMARGCSCYAYDQVQRTDGSRPFFDLSGRIKGQVAVHQAAMLLHANLQGKGSLLGSVIGANPGSVTVVGEPSAAINAALTAANMGASVSLLASDDERAEKNRLLLPENIGVFTRSEEAFAQVLPTTDVLISAVSEFGRAEIVVDQACESLLSSGSVVLDLDISSGGSVERSTPTTIDNPTFILDNVIYFCVSNLCGIVPATASVALSALLLGYLRLFPEMAFEEALKTDDVFFSGLAIFEGHVAESRLASELSITYFDLRIADA